MSRLSRVVLYLLPPPVLAWAALATFRVGPAPVVHLTPGGPSIGRKTPVEVTAEAAGRGLASVKVEIVQQDRTHVLAEKTHLPRQPWVFWGPRTTEEVIHLDLGPATVPGLRSGEAVLRVTATRAGTWLRGPDPVVEEKTLPVRLTPPALHVASTFHYVTQGGAEAVVYRVGETSVKDGVSSGTEWFPGFPLPGGGHQDRFALFAVPYDMSDPAGIRLVTADDAGNHAELGFIDKFTPRPFKTDTIQVNDTFMGKVVPEIRSHTPDLPEGASLIESYLTINRDLRRKNAEALKRLAERTRARFLWTEPFLPLPGGKVMAAFADRRTYLYQGQSVDRQDHLGFDLATTEKSPVPAGNSGIVVLADYFGIYGNAVVVDHGYGLMSLYGHLSSIDVKEGQEVTRAQILGRTGDTGLAGGDHLHFTILIQGVPAHPGEWWDGHWIRDRLARKLGAALPLKTAS